MEHNIVISEVNFKCLSQDQIPYNGELQVYRAQGIMHDGIDPRKGSLPASGTVQIEVLKPTRLHKTVRYSKEEAELLGLNFSPSEYSIGISGNYYIDVRTETNVYMHEKLNRVLNLLAGNTQDRSEILNYTEKLQKHINSLHSEKTELESKLDRVNNLTFWQRLRFIFKKKGEKLL